MKKILYITLLLALFISCKKDTDPEVFTTDLELVVTNQFGVPYQNARVFLYDNKTEFDKAASGTEQAIFVSYTDTDADGKAKFDNLDESIKYYFLAQYGNNTNQNTDFTLKNALIKGSVTTAVIELASTDSYLAFWTRDANNGKINVSISNREVGSISSTRTTQPSLGDTLNSLLVQVSTIPVSYYAVGENGCYWEGTETVETGRLKHVELKSCNTGSIVFFSKDLSNKDEITVTLSQTDVVGTIKNATAVNKTPTCADPEEGLVVKRPAGTYIYKAVSNSCVWTGTITLNSGSCASPVELSDCNK